jgi:hypothetical protein
MNPQAIFGPMLALMLLTLLVWVYMYARRIPFIQRARLRPEQMTSLGFAQLSPPEVANPSDNLKNLLELPTLFYALCLVLYAIGRVDPLGLLMAWWFVAFRYAHSLVHCTFNHILLRFALYVVSAAALWFMVLRAAYWVLWRVLPGAG